MLNIVGLVKTEPDWADVEGGGRESASGSLTIALPIRDRDVSQLPVWIRKRSGRSGGLWETAHAHLPQPPCWFTAFTHSSKNDRFVLSRRFLLLPCPNRFIHVRILRCIDTLEVAVKHACVPEMPVDKERLFYIRPSSIPQGRPGLIKIKHPQQERALK